MTAWNLFIAFATDADDTFLPHGCYEAWWSPAITRVSCLAVQPICISGRLAQRRQQVFASPPTHQSGERPDSEDGLSCCHVGFGL